MAFQPVANTLELTVGWELAGGVEAVNIFHWLLYDYFEPTQAVADAVMGLIGDCMTVSGNELMGALPTTTTFAKLTVTGLNEEGDAQVVSTDSPLTGTSTGQALPDLVAGVITWRTGLRSRSGRGRSYMPASSEEFASGNGPSTDAIDAYQAFADAMLETFNTATGALIVVSRYTTDPDTHLPVKRDIVLKNPIVSGTINTMWGTQRKRRPNP